MTQLRLGRQVPTAVLVAVALCGPLLAFAQVAVPSLTGHVTDQTGTLTPDQKASLEQTLTAFEARRGTQLTVLMVSSTAPEAIEPYALRVAEQWKLGRKKVDDGVILVVAKEDRAVRIEVGYGLEGALNDAMSERIIRETILPRFKDQDFNGGLTAGVAQIISVVDGEPLPEPSPRTSSNGGDFRQFTPVLFILVLAVGGLLRRLLGRLPGALVTGAVVGVLAWFIAGALSMALIAAAIALFVTLMGAGMGLGMLGMGALGGGRGGSGGGYSGGGGTFGGGGASGRW